MTINTFTLSGMPDLALLHQQHPDRYPYLLASTATALSAHRDNCRYDILFAFPGDILRLDDHYRLQGVDEHHQQGDFLVSLNHWLQASQLTDIDSTLPFTGGWFVYLGYELAQQIEPVLELPAPAAGEPVAMAARVPAAIICDHHQHRCHIVVEQGHDALLPQIRQDVDALDAADNPGAVHVDQIIEQDEAAYFEQLGNIHRYIRDGDIFQANLSRLWTATLADDVDDSQLFAALTVHNPASFACLVKLGSTSIISSSPERLVRIRQGVVETRPIAGTRPRSATVEEDLRLAETLLQHPKERAEHIMLIDLERNDLGRVCEAGSIEVNELLTLESWQHVHHIVSNVRGRLRAGMLPGDVLRAVFPGGTITGCPKVRCMQILAEQEQQPRAAYTGTVGYINRDGSMDSNILIRTMMRRGQQLTLRAGGGIVADSDARMELEETRAKARGLLRALQLTEAVCG